MTSYSIEIKQCPKCNSLFSANQLTSCYTINAIYYTDGAIFGPMYSDDDLIITCPRCINHFWNEDVPTIKSISEYEFNTNIEFKSLHMEYSLQKENFIALLNEKFWKTKVQEKYIRIQAWWSFNDIYRGTAYNEMFNIPKVDFINGLQLKEMTEDDFKESFKGKANLLDLLPLINTSSSDDIITKSEVFRELGQFDECIKLLDQRFNDDYLPIVNTIKTLAKDKKQMVAQISNVTANQINLFS